MPNTVLQAFNQCPQAGLDWVTFLPAVGSFLAAVAAVFVAWRVGGRANGIADAVATRDAALQKAAEKNNQRIAHAMLKALVFELSSYGIRLEHVRGTLLGEHPIGSSAVRVEQLTGVVPALTMSDWGAAASVVSTRLLARVATYSSTVRVAAYSLGGLANRMRNIRPSTAAEETLAAELRGEMAESLEMLQRITRELKEDVSLFLEQLPRPD